MRCQQASKTLPLNFGGPVILGDGNPRIRTENYPRTAADPGTPDRDSRMGFGALSRICGGIGRVFAPEVRRMVAIQRGWYRRARRRSCGVLAVAKVGLYQVTETQVVS